MRAILKTGGRTLEQIAGGSIRDPQQMNLSVEDAQIVKNYLDAWDGVHVFLNDDGYLIGWDGDFYNVAKAKEALYLMHQDPVFGLYVDDREGFEKDWAEGEFQPDAGIMFRPDEYIIDTETPKEKYKRLRNTYPQAKVINEISGNDAAGVSNVEITNCHIKEYVFQDGHFLFRDMARNYVDALTWQNEERTIHEYEQARKDAWEIVNGLKWQIGIFLELKTEA